MSRYTFLDTTAAFPLPESFDWDEYIETERELWALFPETDGRRVNFVQIGLTAQIYAATLEDGSELAPNETYILMPCADRNMRPIRRRRNLCESNRTGIQRNAWADGIEFLER